MNQLVLQIAIAFFGVQVAGWAGLCLYIRAAHQRRLQEAVADLAVSAAEPVARAA